MMDHHEEEGRAGNIRAGLVERLLALPTELGAAEEELLHAQRLTQAAREDLADREAGLLLAGPVPGSNAETRAAHVRLATAEWRQALQVCVDEEKAAAVRLRVVQAEFSSLRACTRIIGWPGDEE